MGGTVVVGWEVAPRQFVSNVLEHPGAVEIPLVGLLVHFLLMGAAFPGDITSDGPIVNVYLHVLGLALGFLATFVAYTLESHEIHRRLDPTGIRETHFPIRFTD